MSARKQSKRARFYVRRRALRKFTVAKLRICREILSRNEDAMNEAFLDQLCYGAGAVRIENGVMTHISYPEMWAELEAIADQLDAAQSDAMRKTQ